MKTPITIYGDPISGNCLKVRWVADVLNVPVVWKTVSVLSGEARSLEFLKLNPAGRVPLIQTADDRLLSESNAIMLYLAESSGLIPQERFDKAKMMQWLFWEQYSHEPCIAVRRFHLSYLDRAPADLDPSLLDRGNNALWLMDTTLAESSFFVGESLTLADIALVAYTRMAGEGGFDLGRFPAVQAWIAKVEKGLGLDPYGG